MNIQPTNLDSLLTKIHSFDKTDQFDDKCSNGMKWIKKLNETKIYQLNATKTHQMHEKNF